MIDNRKVSIHYQGQVFQGTIDNVEVGYKYETIHLDGIPTLIGQSGTAEVTLTVKVILKETENLSDPLIVAIREISRKE